MDAVAVPAASPDPTREAAAEPEGARLGIVIGALMLAMLLSALDSTIVATALPTIVGDLGGFDHYSWVVTAYLLTFTVSTPLYGKLGDLYGRKRLFQAAIVIFLVGSALSGLSQDMTQLIAFRALQGLGAGGLMVGSQAIIGDVVSPRERGRYQGYFGAVFGLASVAGPLVGGFLSDNVSWRWVFYVNLPIGMVALVTTAVALQARGGRVQHTIDYLGAVLIAGAATALILVTTWGGNQYDWGSPTIVGLSLAGVAMVGLALLVERRAAEPMLPPRLFGNSIFVVTCAVGLVVGAALFGATTYLPQYEQVVRGQSATSSGLQLIPLMAGVVVASITTGQLVSRYGRYKRYPVAGTLVMAVGMFLLSRLGVDTSSLLAGVFMLVTGIGIGLVMQVLVLVAQNAVEPRDLGTATSTATFFRSIGGSFGVALFGSVFNRQLTDNVSGLVTAAGQPLTVSGDPVSQLAQLPTALQAEFIEAYADAVGTVFLVGVPLAVLAFLIALRLREIPLRTATSEPLAGVSDGFGMARLGMAAALEEGAVRVRAAQAALDRLDQLSASTPVPANQVAGLRRLFEDRIATVTAAEQRARSAEAAAAVSPQGWDLLVELLQTERDALAVPDLRPTPDAAGHGSRVELATGVAALQYEADARMAAARAALARLDQEAARGEMPADTLDSLRGLFESRIARIADRAGHRVARADEVSPAYWALAVELLATERHELARYHAAGEVSGATAHRVDQDLVAEGDLLAV